MIDGRGYNSENVQMLRNIMHPGKSLDIRMELLVPDRIYVFNPIRDFWFKVHAVEYPRLVTHREIEG
ncbi:hypothetical protein [Bradyrhizobium sp. LB11.1]|uniref:hypothetical protein n=1 Tax=Bradyrhizobium sp. LB11.1 TaxID=3156326 RepID=UPI0033966AC6